MALPYVPLAAKLLPSSIREILPLTYTPEELWTSAPRLFTYLMAPATVSGLSSVPMISSPRSPVWVMSMVL